MKASISIVRIWIHLGLIPSADVSLYIWALDYLFFNLLTWGTLLFLGFVFNCVPRCLLFLILYLPLRIYAGGFHAKNKNRLLSHISIYISFLSYSTCGYNYSFLPLGISLHINLHNLLLFSSICH